MRIARRGDRFLSRIVGAGAIVVLVTAVSPGPVRTQQLLVLNRGEDVASVHDIATKARDWLVSVGRDPHELAATSDRHTAFVSSYGGNTISVIDIPSRSVRATFRFEGYSKLHGVWVSAGDTLLWVTAESDRAVLEVDPESGRVRRAWDTGQAMSHMLVGTPDDAKLYVANVESGSVTVIDRGSGGSTIVPTGAGAEGIDITPDGKEVWVSNNRANTISVIDTATDSVVASFPSNGNFPVKLRFTPDGRQAWVSNNASGTVTVFDGRTREFVRTLPVGPRPLGLHFSPDRRYGFVSLPARGEVLQIDMRNGSTVARLPVGGSPDGIMWLGDTDPHRPGPMSGPADTARARTRAVSSDRAQAILDSALERFRAASGPGCAAAAQVGERTSALGAAGLASLEFGAPLGTGTPFHVGSIAKQFIATIALTLHERGDLDLDRPITSVLPELPTRFRRVTGRHLLTHTSGMRDYLQVAHHAGAGLQEPFSRDETLALLARQSRLDFPPGAEASYSNSNYFLLQIMIERTVREALGEVARRLIFEPLGMRSSRFLTDGLEVVPARARGYREAPDAGYRLHEPAPGMGGMLTTLDDLVVWAGHLRRMRKERDPLLAKLTTPAVLPDDSPTHEAAGLRVDERFKRRVIEHNGSNRGFNAYFGWYPDEDVFVIVMCNIRQAGATSLAHEISAALFDQEPPSPRSGYPELDQSTIERLTAYAGAYEPTEGEGALELELESPHAIVTLYGSHPSDSRTGSNVLMATAVPNAFVLSGLPPDHRLLIEAAEPTPTVVIERAGAGGHMRRYRKVSPPGPADIERLEGRFRSDDLNAVYALSVEDETLVLVIERPDGRTVDRGRLVPITRDFYVMARDPVSNMRLERDASGRVLGFELSEPRLRGVAFARMADH